MISKLQYFLIGMWSGWVVGTFFSRTPGFVNVGVWATVLGVLYFTLPAVERYAHKTFSREHEVAE